jgi:hypothetical protein
MKPSILGNIADFTIGNAITIPITKYSSGYSDTLNIYVGTTWIKKVEGIRHNQSITFTSTELNNIYKAMPYVTAASFRFVNTTYNGANVVGTSEKVAAGTIKDDIKPSITNISLTEGIETITDKFGGYVQYQSRIVGNITATAGAGTGIYGYSGQVGSFHVMDNPFTTNVLTISGTNNYSLTVTDQRGRTATETGTFEVLEYDLPQINNFSVIRCDADGEEDVYGEYVKVNASASISPVNNKNDKTFKIQYKVKGTTTWVDLVTNNSAYTYELTDSIHSGFSADNVYDFKFLVTDFFVTAERDVNVAAGFAVIDLKKDGKGIGLGKLSTKDALEIGFDIYDRYDTKIHNGLASYKPNYVDIDPDTTLEELVLTETNTPEGGFWYVRTMFYANKSETANRTQIAYPYNNVSTSLYYRSYYMTGWSDWKSVSSHVATTDYTGVFFAGKRVDETGWVTITPTGASTPTAVYVAFSNTYKRIPVVMLVSSSGVIGSQVLGCSTNGITKAGVNIVVNRTNATPTTIYYYVLGEV